MNMNMNMNMNMKAFYNSVACEFAGLWLNVLPKNSTFTFNPAKTRVLLSI